MKQLVIILAGCVLCISIVFVVKNITKNSRAQEQKSKLSLSSGMGTPTHLRIPSIGIDTGIDSVGLTPSGAMGVPKGSVRVAWYDHGPRPGEKGSAVIDGHSGWKDGAPAAFDTLYKVQTGDKVYVEDESGKTAVFMVRGYHTYGQNEDASNIFISNDGKAHLNLITCSGDWNPVEKSHSDRLVIFADKVEQ